MDMEIFEKQVNKSYNNWLLTGDTTHLKDIHNIVIDKEITDVMAQQQESNPNFIQVADDCEMWG